jgi:hypothetical protein
MRDWYQAEFYPPNAHPLRGEVVILDVNGRERLYWAVERGEVNGHPIARGHPKHPQISFPNYGHITSLTRREAARRIEKGDPFPITVQTKRCAQA